MGLVLDSNLAIADADAADTFPPRIGASTLFRDSGATVTVSAEDTANDGHKENAYKEGFTHDFWKPGSSGTHWIRVSLGSSAKADYMAVAAHDLHQNAGSIKAQYSTDGGQSWNDAHSAVTPGDSSPVMVLFTQVEAADWRLHVSSTGAVAIGVVHIGAVLKLRVGIRAPWTPPYLSQDNRYINQRSEGGQFFGRSLIARGAELRLDLEHVPKAWVRDVWEPTVRLLESYPFFFAARDVDASGGREKEVLYGWTTRQPSSQIENTLWGSISLRARGIVS